MQASRQFLLGMVGIAFWLWAQPTEAQVQETALGSDAREGLTLTVYNQDLGLVSESRRVTLDQGENLLAIEDVSRQLRPETVIFSGDVKLLEQDFAYDLLTPQRLLESSVGETVQVIKTHPQTGEETLVEAEVLSVAGGTVLKIGDRIETGPFERLAFAGLPEGLRARPTLRARIDSEKGGETSLAFSYLTGGLTWRADYVAELSQDDEALDLTALVTLSNSSGAGFDDAKLRLVAGEVRQVQPPVRQQRNVMAMAEAGTAVAMVDSAPAPQSVSDRYLYELDRRVSLQDRETKQVPLLSAAGVKLMQEYRFDRLVNAHQGRHDSGFVNASIRLEIENSEDNALGRPLPGGTVRVYRAADGGPIFVGEDGIGHTPEDETVKITLGEAFDVTARATRSHYERLSNRSYETGQEIVVRNAKDKEVEVIIAGDLPPGWQMLSESHPHEKESASRILWRLTVAPKGKNTLTYKVRIKQ